MSILPLLFDILKSLAAGLFIGIGGFIFLLTKWGFTELSARTNSSKNVIEIGNFISSAMFSVGLILVCVFKMLLYTGKIGLIFEEHQTTNFYITLLIMVIFNIFAAGLFGYIINRIFKNCSAFINLINTVTQSKNNLQVTNDYIKCFIQGLFCGACVHAGVRGYVIIKNKCKGIFVIIWFVCMFVYSGFQHCIANSFYFACANQFKSKSFINVLLCILGNSLGTLPVAFIISTISNIVNKSESMSSSSSSHTNSSINNADDENIE